MCWFENDNEISVIMCEVRTQYKTNERKLFPVFCCFFSFFSIHFGVEYGYGIFVCCRMDGMSQTERKRIRLFIVNRVIRDNWRTRSAIRVYLPFVLFVFIPHFHGVRLGLCVIFETLHGRINFVTRRFVAIHVSHFVRSILATVAVHGEHVVCIRSERDADRSVSEWVSEREAVRRATCDVRRTSGVTMVRVCLPGARVRQGINIFTCFYTSQFAPLWNS